MLANGFLPIPRNQYADDYFAAQNRYVLNVFHECVARAAIYDSRTLYRGQFLASRGSIAERCGISPFKARRALIVLTMEGMIRPASGQPASGRTLVWEVVDFDRYCQTVDQPFVAPESIAGRPAKADFGRGIGRSSTDSSTARSTARLAPAQTNDLADESENTDRSTARSTNRSTARSADFIPHIELKEQKEPTTTNARAPARAQVEEAVGSLSAPLQVQVPAPELVAPQEAPPSFGPCQEDEQVRGLIRLWNASRDETQPEVPLDRLERRGAVWTAVYGAWQRKPDWDHWQDTFKRVGATPFCCGEGERKWVAHIIWAVRSGNWEKLLAGQFGPPRIRHTASTQSQSVPMTYEQLLEEKAEVDRKRREAIAAADAERRAREPKLPTPAAAIPHGHNPGRPRIVLDPRDVFGKDYRPSQPQIGLYPR